MKVSFSLKQIWTMLILFAVVVPIALVIFWYAQFSFDNQLNSALMVERHKHELLRTHVDSEILRFKTLLQNKSDPLALLIEQDARFEVKKEMNKLLRFVISREPAVREVMIMTNVGKVIYAIDLALGVTGEEVLAQHQLQAVATHWGFSNEFEIPEIVVPFAGRQYIGSPKKHDDYFAFSIAVPIGNPTKAVLIAIIDVDRLWPMDENKKGIMSEKATTNYILDRRGALITKLDGGGYQPGDLMTHMAVTRSALIGEQWPKEKAYLGINNASVFGVITSITRLNWTLVSEVSEDEIVQPIINRLIYIIAITLAGIAIFVPAMLYVFRKTLRPIQNACLAIEQVARGNYRLSLNLTGIEELDIMTSGIINMTKAREAAEAALQSKERELREMLDYMAESVISIDERGTILSFNKAAESLFGYQNDEVIGKNIKCLMPESFAGQHDDFIRQYIQTNEASIIGRGREVRGLNKQQQVFAMRLFVAELPKSAEGKRRFIGSCTDLTYVKQQEQQLRRSQKMDALGKLSGGVAHDYNNILGVIMGYGELLESALVTQPKLAKYASNINRAGQRGAKLAKKLLNFSKQESTDAEAFNLNELLIEMRHMLEKMLTVRVNLEFELNNNLWMTRLSSADMEDAILNMVINAMHAIKEGGVIRIKTDNQYIDQMEARLLGLDSEGDCIMLSISDNGCGMNEETKERVFDPFFSTKGEKGTGLGLSQVYGFVERNKGAIKVYSDQVNGTRFVLYFPRYLLTENTIQPQIIKPKKFRNRQERILVVDDEVDLLNLSCEILKANHYQVFAAENAEKALKILESETIDLVLSDVIMPAMDGFELAEKIQANYPGVKIQLVSGYTDDRHIECSDDSLQKNLLRKPYSSQALLDKIQHLLNAD